MKSLLVFCLLIIGSEAMAQVPWGWPNYTPVTVPVVQPIVVQEIKFVPIVENKVVYQQGAWIIYCPVVPVQPLSTNAPHRCRLFWNW